MKEYVRVAELAGKIKVSKSTIWRWVQEGRLPKPFKPTLRTTLFDMEACQKAMDKMAAADFNPKPSSFCKAKLGKA